MQKNIGESQIAISNLLLNIYDEQEAKTIARNLFLDYFNIDNNQLEKLKKRPLKAADEIKIEEFLARLLRGEPLQYVTGKAHFYQLILYVNFNVLIPRPETEELVFWILQDYKSLKKTDLSIIDIGTGSGCIAVALKKNLPSANVKALDVSENALNVAAKNALKHKVNINFVKEDILAETDLSTKDEFDIIVSNPPYVTLYEQEKMHENVLNHEPHLALFVPENDPLIFYKAIADFALRKLKPGGKIYLEINQYLADDTQKLYNDKGFNTELRKDMQGNFRMIKAWK